MGTSTLVIVGLVVAVLALIVCTVILKIHPFFSLIFTSVVFAVVSGMSLGTMLDAFAAGMVPR